jgi:hypothetical protein
MAPFDALYGRRCRTPLNWLEAGKRTLFGPDLVKDAEERVQVIRENLKMAQMRQKSYHDNGTAPRHFEVGDYVYLKVSPTKGVQTFGVKGKLAPRYIGPYEVIEVCGSVAYRIQLPERFSAVHNVFHVTQLKKGMPVPENEIITEAKAWIEPDFSLIEHPLKVLTKKSERPEGRPYGCTRSNGVITWKKKQRGRRRTISTLSIRPSYRLETVSSSPHLLVIKSNLGTRFRLRGVCCDAPVLTDKRRIPLRSASVRTPHLFHHEIPKVLVNPRSKGITSA